MQTVFSIAIDAVAYGMVLFVISIGLSVTMGLMRVVNLAHGAFAMIGGYIASYAGAKSWIGLCSRRSSCRRRHRDHFDPDRTAALPANLRRAGIDAGPDDHRHHLLHHRHRELCLRPDLEDDPAAGGAAGIGRSRFQIDRRASPVCHRPAGSRWPVHSGLPSRKPPLASSCAPPSTMPPWLRRWACVRKSSTRSVLLLRSALRLLAGSLAPNSCRSNPIMRCVTWSPSWSSFPLAGAGSIPGALLACLVLGGIDTTGRYLMPEFGEFFFYLAVIAIICIFPRGLAGRAR